MWRLDRNAKPKPANFNGAPEGLNEPMVVSNKDSGGPTEEVGVEATVEATMEYELEVAAGANRMVHICGPFP